MQIYNKNLFIPSANNPLIFDFVCLFCSYIISGFVHLMFVFLQFVYFSLMVNSILTKLFLTLSDYLSIFC